MLLGSAARRAVSHLLASTSAPAGASVEAARRAERWFGAAAAAEPEPVAETGEGGEFWFCVWWGGGAFPLPPARPPSSAPRRPEAAGARPLPAHAPSLTRARSASRPHPAFWPPRVVATPRAARRVRIRRCRRCSLSRSHPPPPKKEPKPNAGIDIKGIHLRGSPLYLDMQATTPTDPRVLDAMLPWMTERVRSSFRAAFFASRSRLSAAPSPSSSSSFSSSPPPDRTAPTPTTLRPPTPETNSSATPTAAPTCTAGSPRRLWKKRAPRWPP
jgi:hypothetical protein